MQRTKFIAGILLLSLLVITAVLLVRMLAFTPTTLSPQAIAPVTISQQAIFRLSRAVQIKTISSLANQQQRELGFQQFQAFLARSFPLLHSELEIQRVNEFALIYRWPGLDNSLQPALLLSHQDVVPVEASTLSDWHYPPFAGDIAEGYLWGRGAWDDKSTLMATLEAVEMLLAAGAQPKRTLILAFGHDEEVGGQQGAAAIAQQFRQQELMFDYILDEGHVIGEGLVSAVEKPIAMVAIAEKGYLTLRLSSDGPGGHSSVPPEITTVGRIARAVTRLQEEPFAASLTQPVAAMLAELGPYMPWTKRLVLSNLWLFEPLLVATMADSRSTQAQVRTTIAPTMFNAGVKENVLPQAATAVVNFRILPGQTRQQIIEQVTAIIDDPAVAIKEVGSISSDPSPISPPDSQVFKVLKQTIQQVNPDVLVSPALLFGATDSRHFIGLSDNIYRFTPIRVNRADIQRIHGTNERIAVSDYENAIRFYHQLITSTVINPAL